jgi:hypothetical protein
VTCFEYDEPVAKQAIEKYRGKGDGQIVAPPVATPQAQAPAAPAPAQPTTPVQPQAAPQVPPTPQTPPAPKPQPDPAPAPSPAPADPGTDDAFAKLIEQLRGDGDDTTTTEEN